MKRILLVGAILVGGCSNPVAPTQPAVRMPGPAAIPAGLNICYTQPRRYCSADMSACWLEVDFYFQSTPCPATPIE